MFSHIMLGARDLTLMVEFYDVVLSPFALHRDHGADPDDPAGTIWRKAGRRWPQFAIRKPVNGLPATWGNGLQISFAAHSRAIVDEAWRTAIEHGGLDEGAPGLRPKYAEDFYSAYCRDPEGNKLCFAHANGMTE